MSHGRSSGTSSIVIDFHVHAFPDNLQLPTLPGPLATMPEKLGRLRRTARSWVKPVASSLHRAQTLMRHLPQPLLEGMDELTGVVPIAGLLFESSVSDLLEGMEDNEIDQAILIAHPPVITNELVIEAGQKDSRLIPAVNIAKSTGKPAAELERYFQAGARVLKIHPAADGEGPSSKRYRTLLASAENLKLPVIIHTGCLHSRLLYKNASFGNAELFKPWFKDFPNIQFVLAHMNFHKPNVAMDLACEFQNVFVDTSWQPAETIGEAVRRIGAERVLFGSDWPLLGNNLSVGLQRIEDCLRTGLVTRADAELIRGKNALRLLAHVQNTRSDDGL